MSKMKTNASLQLYHAAAMMFSDPTTVRMLVCVRVCVCVFVYGYICVLCVYVYACYICACVCVYVCIMYMRLHLCMHVCKCTVLSVYMLPESGNQLTHMIPKRTHTHTPTHTQTHTRTLASMHTTPICVQVCKWCVLTSPTNQSHGMHRARLDTQTQKVATR